ncbi:MAG: hypothetical protein ACC726_03675 [Chloroflexota bacterium]
MVSPPSISDGTTIVVGSLTLAGLAREGRSHGAAPTDIPFRFFAGSSDSVASYLGSWYSGWYGNPYPCPGLDDSFSGYWQREMWWKLTVPAHPADMAGIRVSVSTGAPGGVQGPSYASIAPLDVVVLSGQPTALRQGVPVGQVAASSSAIITVPAGEVPAEGSELWIGFQTSWECNRADPGNYVCGWTWPFSSYAGNVDKYGDPWGGYSGKVGVNTPTAAIWQVWASAGAALGAIATPARAPWVGGNTVLDGGTEGAPTDWRIDGQAFVVTAEEPAGKALTVVGEREDDAEPYGPWSDVQWAAEIVFEVDAIGDILEAGPRNIQLITTGEGERTVGTVHLGDLSSPMGISVGGPSSVEFAAKTLTVDEKWVARFDTRSGRIRGKLWKQADGEPALWDVVADIGETEDELDRYDLWVRVGNGAGDAQTAKVHRLRAFDGARAGQRVVKESIGFADGLTKTFPTAHRYRENTLRAYVNGIGVGPLTQDGAGAEFTLDFWPTARSIIAATYIADDAPDT